MQYHVNVTSVLRELNQRWKKKNGSARLRKVFYKLNLPYFFAGYFQRTSRKICESYTHDFLNTVQSILIFVRPLPHNLHPGQLAWNEQEIIINVFQGDIFRRVLKQPKLLIYA